MKKLLFLLLLLISSFAFSQENPSAVEDAVIKRCVISSLTKNTWISVYLGSKDFRKNITIISDSVPFGRVTKVAFKNSDNLPDTSTGYYLYGNIKQWRNRNSDYMYIKSDTTGSFWITIEYTNGPSIETGTNTNQILGALSAQPIPGNIKFSGDVSINGRLVSSDDDLAVSAGLTVRNGANRVSFSGTRPITALSQKKNVSDTASISFVTNDSTTGKQSSITATPDSVSIATNLFKVNGANYQTRMRTVSTDDTLRANDNIVHIDASSQNVTLETIPANTCTGLILKVKIIDVSNVGSINFNPDLEGSAYAFTVLNEVIQFYSDGTTWRVLSIYKP